ncbi:hypothetical protein FCK90_09325 [Kocuria coralli]|uniref:O-antigen ligase family protein n=1 Tax=Kocuria coralli TaxID=1461025 RepID=A0A5J5KW29_9MICC|nr:hypothetical protein [Kocuria coralli]KAA9393863.1 hypothetical protein FCK90_09325 [Kocuria coralli]
MVEVATVLTVILALLMGGFAVLLLGTAAFVHPKVTAGLIVLITMLSQTIQTVTGVNALGYGDELGVLLALLLFTGRRLYLRGSIRFYPALWFFLAFALLGVVSSIVNDVSLGTLATGGFLFLKGPALGFAVAQLDWRREDIPHLIRAGVIFILFVLVTVVINAVQPAAWNAFIGRVATISERAGFSSLTGPFDHPVGLGTMMSMAFLAILLYRQLVRKGVFSFALLCATGLTCIAAFRRKSIAAATITAVGMRAMLPGPKALYLALLAVLIPAALMIGWDPLTAVVQSTYQEYTENVVETARVRMTVDSVALSLGAFPLGVGFGRFASFTAGENYSPLYQDFGYQWIYGMGPGERGGFLSDTFWPAPLAETGLLGALCYAGGLYLLAVTGWRLMRRSPSRRVRWMGAVTVAWFVTLGIESVVAPVFVSPPMFALPFVAAGIATALTASLKEASPDEPAGEAELSYESGEERAVAPWNNQPPTITEGSR